MMKNVVSLIESLFAMVGIFHVVDNLKEIFAGKNNNHV